MFHNSGFPWSTAWFCFFFLSFFEIIQQVHHIQTPSLIDSSEKSIYSSNKCSIFVQTEVKKKSSVLQAELPCWCFLGPISTPRLPLRCTRGENTRWNGGLWKNHDAGVTQLNPVQLFQLLIGLVKAEIHPLMFAVGRPAWWHHLHPEMCYSILLIEKKP